MTREEIFAAIDAERARADKLHPIFPFHDGMRLAVLTEEVGEVATEVQRCGELGTLQCDLDARLREELIQVCSAAVRWLENL